MAPSVSVFMEFDCNINLTVFHTNLIYTSNQQSYLVPPANVFIEYIHLSVSHKSFLLLE